jgi:hypothetical protein
MNASQVLAMGASMPRAVPAVPLFTNNPLGEEQLTGRLRSLPAPVAEKELVINSAPAKPVEAPRTAQRTEPKLISVPIVQNAVPITRAKPEVLPVPRPRQITQNVPVAVLPSPALPENVLIPARKGIKEIMNRNVTVPKTIPVETIKYTSEPVQQVAINKGAVKPERKMKSMVAEALAPPMFASTQAPPQTIALPPRAPIAPSVEFAPPVAQTLEQTKKPMFAETNRTDLVNLMTKPTPTVIEARQGKRTIEFGEGKFRLLQQRGGAREGAGRPPNSLRLPPAL